jgi:hypothetical protein
LPEGSADELAAAWTEFPRRRFITGLVSMLAPFGLMAPVDSLVDRLAAGLPEASDAATEIAGQVVGAEGVEPPTSAL